MSLLRHSLARGVRPGPRGREHRIPAPVKGLNTRDGVAAMKKDYAVALDNFFPETGVVRVRGGSRVYSALSGPVLALAPHALSLFGLYSNPDGTTHLVRVQAGNAVELETGLTGTRWTSEE